MVWKSRLEEIEMDSISVSAKINPGEIKMEDKNF